MRASVSRARRGSPLEKDTQSPADHPFADGPASTRPVRVHGSTARVISFGLFRLLPAQRLLLHADKTVPLKA